ncbi:MAG: protein kinase, partial [Gemmatimonadetes bacterium]|nr:protein kinase [Gemmatimonadota bacterium]
MNDAPETPKCPNCGTPLAPGARFCHGCGMSFSTTEFRAVTTGTLTPPSTPARGTAPTPPAAPVVGGGRPTPAEGTATERPDPDAHALEEIRSALEGRYAVERVLGRGGMATVYLATDVKHERQVAIKVLLPELSASLGAERFEREIRVAAKLQHPHILGLFDSGVADGLVYYVMPYVTGESLRARIDREGMLPVDDA